MAVFVVGYNVFAGVIGFMSMVDRYTTPLLTAQETARHLQIPPSTLNRWLATPNEAPLVHAVVPAHRAWPRVPFVGIVEAYVLRSLRDIGLSMPAVEEAAEAVRRSFKDPYALASQKIATDGVDIFLRLADKTLARARDGQTPIHEVINDYLTFITWDEDGMAKSLRLRGYEGDASVVIDPRFAWGAPVIEQTRTPVSEVVSLWRAGDSIEDIAYEFELEPAAVEHVLQRAA